MFVHNIRYTNNRIWVLTNSTSNNLTTFLISRICYCTCIDNIYISFLFIFSSFISTLFKQLPNGFCFIVVLLYNLTYGTQQLTLIITPSIQNDTKQHLTRITAPFLFLKFLVLNYMVQIYVHEAL